ncbi:hypothetical protein AURDEDRAFT_125263 [Auricularia subglabra TFB-10046 SS5]|nr:hypothetical protein AURDEDRAFT_125263 [Auricularia subglabra TFB-10046 SS5]
MHKSHVSSACAECRSRKIKCDGRRPVCSSCAGPGTRPIRECVFAPERDGRRRANCAGCKSLKSENLRLQDENRKLEDEIGPLKDENALLMARLSTQDKASRCSVPARELHSDPRCSLQPASGDLQGDSPPKTPQTALFEPDDLEGVRLVADSAVPSIRTMARTTRCTRGNTSSTTPSSPLATLTVVSPKPPRCKPVDYGSIFPDDEQWIAAGEVFSQAHYGAT